MGGALNTEIYRQNRESTELSYRNSTCEPQCHDMHLIHLLRIIFKNELAKSAFINFIRHEDSIYNYENYFKNANFALIGNDERKVSEVLSQHSEEDEKPNEIIYESLRPFFDSMNPSTKQLILRYKGGSAQDMLDKFQKVIDEVILMMAIESLPRFEASESFKKWWSTENGTEYSVTGLFSFHGSSRRTATLQASTGKEFEAIWSDKGDIFPAILHCLNSFPVASAIIRHNETHQYQIIYASEDYAKIFDTTISELIQQPFNLLSSEKVKELLKNHSNCKMDIEYNSDEPRRNKTLALCFKPIFDQDNHCIYFYVIVVDMTNQLFNLERLKLSSDLFDILPSKFTVRYKLAPISQHGSISPKPSLTISP